MFINSLHCCPLKCTLLSVLLYILLFLLCILHFSYVIPDIDAKSLKVLLTWIYKHTDLIDYVCWFYMMKGPNNYIFGKRLRKYWIAYLCVCVCVCGCVCVCMWEQVYQRNSKRDRNFTTRMKLCIRHKHIYSCKHSRQWKCWIYFYWKVHSVMNLHNLWAYILQLPNNYLKQQLYMHRYHSLVSPYAHCFPWVFVSHATSSAMTVICGASTCRVILLWSYFAPTYKIHFFTWNKQSWLSDNRYCKSFNKIIAQIKRILPILLQIIFCLFLRRKKRKKETSSLDPLCPKITVTSLLTFLLTTHEFAVT